MAYDPPFRFLLLVNLFSHLILQRPALRAASAPGTPRGGNRRSLLGSSDAVRSEEEFEQVLSQLRELDNADPDSRYLHSVAEIPPLILDSRVRACRYLDTNGFVEDSFALERERKAGILWTDEEKDVFIKKYLPFPLVAELQC